MSPNTEPLKAVTYRRVSTSEQAVSGLGLSAQQATIDRALEARGWVAVADLVDEGVSGKLAPEKRPQLAEALRMLANGTADVLVVAKLDRATRSVGDLCELLDLAARQGWDFVADDLGIDTATPMGRAMAQIAGVFSELERNLIAERTRSALAVRRSQGVRLGRPVNLPDRIRERIATERALGSTLTAIADRLNIDGVPTSQGAPAWTHATVRAVLRSVEVDEAMAGV